MTAASSPLAIDRLENGRLWVLRLARPKANVIDGAMTAALRQAFRAAKEEPALAAVVLCADGPHFSFGASVQEHLPEQVGSMLREFHGLFADITDAGVPVLAAVRGQCLGGGLEVAAFAHRLFAAPDAKLGQPEIALGVFAPVGSLWLPRRIGRGAAEDLCLSGRTIGADEALRLGLVDAVAQDPDAAALGYAREHLLRHSASSLRHAVRAVRGHATAAFLRELAEVERAYLHGLMATADAAEGIRAFLDRRSPQWRHS